VLLRRDPGEDAVEMLVLDDDAGHEPRVIAGMQAIREHAAVAANGDRAVGGSLTSAVVRRKRRFSTPSSRT